MRQQRGPKLFLNAAFVARVVDFAGLYLDPPEHAAALCVDRQRRDHRARPVIPMNPGMSGLFNALDVADRRADRWCPRGERAVEYESFLNSLDRAIPPELDVHLICDNDATCETPLIKAWLAGHRRFSLNLTESGMSWSDELSCWFGHRAGRALRRGVSGLEGDVRAWLQVRAPHPRPFRWTRTGEEIRDSYATYRASFDHNGRNGRVQ